MESVAGFDCPKRKPKKFMIPKSSGQELKTLIKSPRIGGQDLYIGPENT